VSGRFSADYKVSIGTNMFIKEVDLDSGVKVKIHLWDIAGQERWTQMRHIYYKGSQGVIIVGDLTRKYTFKQIEEFWYPDIEKYCKKVPCILLANKNDLIKNITKEEVESYSVRVKAKSIMYTSAKTGTNVEKAFKFISELITI
jgi:small GTP-binding protein